ncbi:PQQ-binding-like beta-propeller repeat protein [Zavarzinella formosa]|uniref:PQQ-binding-like beta-propeller repeat protein n=1 Tax=Zavarzinella formosa TaxID=360055 RepID=UPI0002DAC906|nr:PQQ-binding-like beta-propeller repeat protein [Zavarzinella formosa]
MSRLFPIIMLVPALLGADWPQHLGPTRDSRSPETGLLRAFPAGGPAVVWKREVGSGWAGSAVQKGKLILFHRVEADEVVECLDATTGKELWKQTYRSKYRDDFEFDDGPRSTPLIDDSRVITLGANGQLSAWDFASGKSLWARNINDDYQVPKGFFGVATSPMIAGGKLLINVGAKKAGVVAFDPATGKELWKAGDDGVSYSSPVMAKIAGDELAVFFTRAGLLAVLPEDGKIKFQHPWRPRLNSSVNAASPIVSKDRMFLTTSYGTGAIVLEGTKTGLKEVWQSDEVISSHFSTPVLIGGFLYGIDGRQEARARLRCADWEKGTINWTKEGFGCAGLIVADGMLIATPENGDVVLIDPSPKAYKELARASVLDAPVRALPALSGGMLFVRDGKKMVALKMTPDGK